ncbi:hypothetical protein [Burkholderia gladioli]|uniref:hypothetical protein n=1 Tax=Burkholderia gladioli TaxID=28095 RepID=UPI001FC8B711|nr:hypothetical protein [Burkholderia gladioli]
MQRGSRLKADKGTTETVGERDFLSPADIASSWGYHHQFILTIRKQGQEMLLSLYSRITLLRATSLMRIERLPASLRELDKLHKALKERNAEAAEVAARRHVEAAQEAAMQMLPATSE